MSSGHDCRSKDALSTENDTKSQEGSKPWPDRVIAMTDASHAAVMGLSSATGTDFLHRHLHLAHSPASLVSNSHSASSTSEKQLLCMAQDTADHLGKWVTLTCRRAQSANAQAESDHHAFL